MLRHLSYPYSQEKMAPEPPFGPDPPPFGHIGGEFKKQREKKGTYTGLQRGMKLSLATNLVSTHHCSCYVYCSYKW
jgi:hypothetical protein